jgi:hypothetical protein
LETDMRITGRILRPSTLAERRLMLSIGEPAIKVPRGVNPFLVARRLSRAARDSQDVLFARDILQGRRRKPKPPSPRPSPDADDNDMKHGSPRPVA